MLQALRSRPRGTEHLIQEAPRSSVPTPCPWPLGAAASLAPGRPRGRDGRRPASRVITMLVAGGVRL